MNNLMYEDFGLVKPNHVVRQHNDLIGAVFKLSLTQIRMFYYCIAQIELDEVIDVKKRFYIDVKGFAKLFNIEAFNARKQIKEEIDSWAEQWFQLDRLDPVKKVPILSRWISEKGVMVEDTGIINFTHNLIPLISELKNAGNYTRARIGQLAKLGTFYDFRFYNYAIEAFRKPSYDPLRTRNFILTPTEIRTQFEIEGKYSKTFDLKNKVLNPSIENISERTDIILRYVQIKKGRSIVGFDFHVIPKKEINSVSNENPYSRIVLTVDDAKQLTKNPKSMLFKDLQELGYLIDFGNGEGAVNYFIQKDRLDEKA